MNGSSLKKSRNFKQVIEKIRITLFNRLRTRLLLTLAFLSIIPLIAAGFFMISVMEESLTEHIKNQHNEIIRRASNEIRLFLETPITILETLPESQDIVEMNPFAQNLILAAHSFGVESCLQASVTGYAGEIKKLLGVPENKKLIICISLGYPDNESKLNTYRAIKQKPEAFTKWYR